MKFRPLGDRVLVLPLEQDHKIEGFQLPDSATEKEAKAGVVLEVGPKCVEGLKKGDRVIYGAYAGIELLIEGQLLVRMREGEIDGVLESDCQHLKIDNLVLRCPDITNPLGQVYDGHCADCGFIVSVTDFAISQGHYEGSVLHLTREEK